MNMIGRTYVHPFILRAKPITALAVLVLLSCFTIRFASYTVREIASGVSADRVPFMIGVSILGLVLEMWLAVEVWRYWFLLHGYELADGVLTERDLLFGKVRRLRLEETQTVYSYRTSGRHAPNSWGIAHVLIGTDGTKISLTEALPIWPQIAQLLPYQIVQEMNRPE